ncbi:hypothetical protein DFR79_12348 [Halanaerobium saccharolyticum]|uniref:DUF2953 family protein n=1 Tax=Halanaerobium saccharolyticum TaxID=43595 RepID=A0A4R6LIM4_9FIRM|nr:hypothetical protein [Halanaerobium saccharolyticum]TDO83507.1 hypothetical protein DFR79_12348 [Halanaerobium saccharolyticum]
MLQFLFLFIIFVIFFIILFLALPYYYAFDFEYKKQLKFRFAFSLFFLQFIFTADSGGQLFFFKILNYKKKININENNIAKFMKNKSKKVIKEKIVNKTAENKKEKPEESRKKSKFKFDFSLINKKNLNHIFRFIVKLIKILKMDYLKLNLVFSFADPYYNGIFLAYYYTFKELFDYPDFKARINWQEVMFEAEGSTGGKIIPLKIIAHFLIFIFSIRSLKIFWQLYKSNSKKG